CIVQIFLEKVHTAHLNKDVACGSNSLFKQQDFGWTQRQKCPFFIFTTHPHVRVVQHLYQAALRSGKRQSVNSASKQEIRTWCVPDYTHFKWPPTDTRKNGKNGHCKQHSKYVTNFGENLYANTYILTPTAQQVRPQKGGLHYHCHSASHTLHNCIQDMQSTSGPEINMYVGVNQLAKSDWTRTALYGKGFTKKVL
ncbi:hypothetical protein BaRGS_00010253, partial [Batillaria attramentaria]